MTAVVSSQLLAFATMRHGQLVEKRSACSSASAATAPPLPFTYRATKGGGRASASTFGHVAVSRRHGRACAQEAGGFVLEAAADRMGGGTCGTGGGGGVTAADDAPATTSSWPTPRPTWRAALRTKQWLGLGHLLGALGMNLSCAAALPPGASWDERDPAGRSALQWAIARSQHVAAALLRRAEARHGRRGRRCGRQACSG